MRARFRPFPDEPPNRYLVLVPEARTEREFCRALMAFWREHDR